MAGRLNGKTALVTGSGQSIGRAIALLLAREGANLVVNSRTEVSRDDTPTAKDTAAEIRKAGGNAVPVYADVATLEGVGQLIDAASREFGGVDILVNNAGVGAKSQPVEDVDEGAWRSMMEINLDSQFRCSRAVIPMMREKGWGRIINMGSAVGFYGMPGYAAYGAAKGGVHGLTFCMAHEFIGTGITANCILPSAATTRNNRDRAEREKRTGVVVPLSPARVPEAVAPLAAFLASDAAAEVNGQLFTVSGGVIAHHQWPPAETLLEKDGIWELGELEQRFGPVLGNRHGPARPPR